MSGLNFQVGPQIGFLIKSKFIWENTSPQVITFINTDFYKKVDFTLGLGIGYEMKKISFSTRYNLGLLNIIDKEAFLYDNKAKIRNGVLQFSVGYAL